jgi:hypothetical protein
MKDEYQFYCLLNQILALKVAVIYKQTMPNLLIYLARP